MGAHEVRVLLIEDNPADAILVRHALSGWNEGDFTLKHFARLSEGLPMLVRGLVDVVLLDLTLPDSAGVPSVERAHVMARDIPIVVLTGADDDELGLACIEAGAADYLTKDALSAHTLRRAVSFALERRTAREVGRLEQTLARYRALADAGAELGRETALASPEVRELMERHYDEVLASYVDRALGREAAPPDLDALASSLGDLGASSRDTLSLHLAAVDRARASTSKSRARATAGAARQLALDVMGALLEHYRAGPRRPSSDAGAPAP